MIFYACLIDVIQLNDFLRMRYLVRLLTTTAIIIANYVYNHVNFCKYIASHKHVIASHSVSVYFMERFYVSTPSGVKPSHIKCFTNCRTKERYQ